MWKTVCPASRLVLKTVRKPPVGDPALPRNGRRPPHHLADQLIVFPAQVVQRRDVTLGHDETCVGACGLMSLKASSTVVLIHDGARDLVD